MGAAYGPPPLPRVGDTLRNRRGGGLYRVERVERSKRDGLRADPILVLRALDSLQARAPTRRVWGSRLQALYERA